MHIPKHKHHFLEIHKLKHQNQLWTYNEIISTYRLKHNVLVSAWHSHLYVYTLESVSIQRTSYVQYHGSLRVPNLQSSLLFNEHTSPRHLGLFSLSFTLRQRVLIPRNNIPLQTFSYMKLTVGIHGHIACSKLL